MPLIDPDLVNYPFLPRARELLGIIPPDDADLPSKEIEDQARYRIDRAQDFPEEAMQLTRGRKAVLYTDYATRTGNTNVREEVVEFYSFFVAVQACAKDSYLTARLARAEAQRAKMQFVKERLETKVMILCETIPGFVLNQENGGRYECKVENYLSLGSKYDFFEQPNLKLVNLPLKDGIIHFDENNIQDLFASVVDSVIINGMRAMRKSPIPAYIRDFARALEPYVTQRSQTGSYRYIEKLLKFKISDARHRVIWLILAPYFTTVKGMDEASATEAILDYVGDQKYRQFTRYHVRRALKQGLMPLSEGTIRKKHPDIFEALPKDVFA